MRVVNAMDTWLWENRQQYKIFVGLVQLLLDSGFSPLTTEPASDRSFRTDHTEAVIQLLTSFSPGSVTWPLRVFSTGPLFRSGSMWTDAIDVEWLGPVGSGEETAVLGLAAGMVELLGEQGIVGEDLTMVYGHAGWLKQVGTRLGLDPVQFQSLENALRRGRLTELDDILGGAPATALRLFRPQTATQFFADLNLYLNATPSGMPPSPWQTRWDLSLVGRHSYYSGLVFCLYHPRSGQPLVTGGQFALPEGGPLSQGIGFTVDLDACRVALREVAPIV